MYHSGRNHAERQARFSSAPVSWAAANEATGTRTLVDGLPSKHGMARGWWQAGAAARLDFEIGGDWMSVSHPHEVAFVAGNYAPLIRERAATRGRSATEGGR